MVMLDLLDSNTVYLSTRPPIIMPETNTKRKKNQAYVVWAPSPEAGLKYMAETKAFRFRYLTKYFIPKKWSIKPYAQPNKIIKMNANGEYTDLINKYRGNGCLKTIDGVTSFIPTDNGANALKDLNVLVEMNFIFEEVLNNPKDRRIPTKKIDDLVHALKSYFESVVKRIGDYRTTIVIPMNLWFNADEYRQPELVMRKISQNPMGIFLGYLRDINLLSYFGRVVLIDGPVVMILEGNAIPEEDNHGKKIDPKEEINDAICAFMSKAYLKRRKNKDQVPGTESPTVEEAPPEEEEDEEEEVEAAPAKDDNDQTKPERETKSQAAKRSMKAAEEKTVEIIKAEEVLDKIKVDPDTLGDDETVMARNIVKKAEGKPTRPVRNQPVARPSQIETPDLKIPPVPDLNSKELQDLEKIKIPDADLDALLAAKISGHSVASEKRNQMLKEKYKDLKIGDTPLTELAEAESQIEIPEIPVQANTVNKSLTSIKGQRFEEVYDKNIAQHDLVSILMHFSGVKPALYLNKDIQITDISTRTDRILKYTVEFEDENRKRHRFSFRLPKMYKHKYLFLNGQELVITHQKLPFPITKVQPDRCQLVTNYNKIFIYRYGQALSPRMTKLKKILSNGNIAGIAVKKGDCTILNKFLMTTIEYDELASSFVKLMIGRTNSNSLTIFFDPDEIAAVFDTRVDLIPKIEGEPPEVLLPLAIRKKNGGTIQYWLSGNTNQVYDDTGLMKGELSDFIITAMIEINPDLEKDLADTTVGSKFIYSKVHIMDKEIPLILVMGASDPGGLVGALEKGKIKYQFVEKRPTVDKNITGVIPFSDGYLVFDRYPYENSLLMNGLNTFPTREYSFYDLGTRDAYVDIFETMCGQKTLADNMAAFYYMMIDPITKDVLRRLNMPTNFISLLYFCNGALADNSFQIDSNYENSRIRSNEIIMAHLYRELAVAWGNYRSGRTDTFSIPENAIITLLLTSKIIDPKSKLNITLELENDRNVKLKGPSGMNEDHSFTIEKRAYHPSMCGIVATNSTPSGEVGINRHMVINPNIADARGFITINKTEEYDGTELLSPGEALSPFGAEAADIERLCMSISQAKHLVPVASQCSCPVSFDFERVAPYLSNDFAYQAKQDGKVVEIKDDLLIVQYADGTFDDIDLSEHPAKNTDGGFFIMNHMDCNLKPGNKFKAGQIIAFDKKYINDNDFFGDPSANVGTLARVAFESNGNVYEDSGYITDDFAHRFATRITKQKRIILSPFANIKYMAKIGQQIQANDPILAFDDTEDEFSSQLLASIADQVEDEDEIVATTAPVISKHAGVIKDINIIYTVPVERMTPSLKKVVQTYAKDAQTREKTLSKYVDIRDSNTIMKSSEMAVPDSRGKVGGVKVDEGIIIDFYIEYEDVAGNGDKGSIGALKFTTCDVIPTDLAAFSESNPDRKIDVYVASFGAFKRMVADVEKIGILTKVLVEKKRMMKAKYGQRVKEELKKAK